jgi:hypothetical protein
MGVREQGPGHRVRGTAAWSILVAVATGCAGPEVGQGGDAVLAGGGGVDGTPGTGQTRSPTGTVDVPRTYEFESRFEPGNSSVSYSGQVFRQVLIADVKRFVGGLTSAIDADQFDPMPGDVKAALDFYYRFDDSSSRSEPVLIRTDPPTLQERYGDITSGKDLVSKTAGNDKSTDHRDWGSEFAGWQDDAIARHGGSIHTPEGLIDAILWTLDHNAADREANGAARLDPDGTILPVQVTEEGWDLLNLLDKFLIMSVTFSQGTDDYLDDDIEDKGLLTDNTEPETEGALWTALEHAWDEAFGYFGAARHYALLENDVIASPGYSDADGDGKIDLLSEHCFAASVNAAKRDLGSAEAARTDFTRLAIDGFLAGRAVIANADGALNADQMSELVRQRNQVVSAWEQAFAATVVHYINEVLKDMDAEPYSFTDHAKHWSEMKGFALGLQFNPRSPLLPSFQRWHELVGDRPVLPMATTEAAAYRARLLEARALLQEAYGFAAANMGDDAGKGGW